MPHQSTVTAIVLIQCKHTKCIVPKHCSRHWRFLYIRRYKRYIFLRQIIFYIYIYTHTHTYHTVILLSVCDFKSLSYIFGCIHSREYSKKLTRLILITIVPWNCPGRLALRDEIGYMLVVMYKWVNSQVWGLIILYEFSNSYNYS